MRRTAPLHLTPYFGGLRFTVLGEVVGTQFDPARGLGQPGDLLVDVDLDAEPTRVLGITLGWAAAGWLDLRLNAALASTTLRVTGTAVRRDGTGGLNVDVGGVGDVAVRYLGLDAVWRPLGRERRLSPFLAVGAGVDLWDLDRLEDLESLAFLVGARFGFKPVDATLLAATLGAGAEIRLTSRLALRLELLDRVDNNPVDIGDFQIGETFAGAAEAAKFVHNIHYVGGLALFFP
ncbi:MAG: hypothetical protein HY703_04900 [Gemmatimonadetes bacterium]|nr:hypothetical protein [Gemmatimonadota bacterium]